MRDDKCDAHKHCDISRLKAIKVEYISLNRKTLLIALCNVYYSLDVLHYFAFTLIAFVGLFVRKMACLSVIYVESSVDHLLIGGSSHVREPKQNCDCVRTSRVEL